MAQERKRRRRKLTRREFLTGSAAAGVALGIPGLLAGCGDGDGQPRGATPTRTPTPVPHPREQRTLHFDLSFADITEPRLRALLSAHDGLALTPHTAETRTRFRAENPLLEAIADERLTHFAENVDLPADSLQHFWITGREALTGEPALLGLQIHVPQAVRRTLAAHQRVSGQPRVHAAKVRAYGLGAAADTLTLEDLAPTLDEFVTPWDTAAALVFHHPEIMNVNLEQGTAILDLIQTLPCTPSDQMCDPYLSTLAYRIARSWPARTTPGGWATLVQLTNLDDGAPVFDDEGNPVYHYDPADETVAAAQQTVRAVLKRIFDDARFAGSNWHHLEGSTVRSHTPVSRATPGDGTFDLEAEFGVGTAAHGMRFVDLQVADAMKRTIELGVKNDFMRCLSVFVQYGNAAGPLPVQQPNADRDTERTKAIGLVFTNDTVMGFPLLGDLTRTQTVRFDVPREASTATLYFGSLGLGGNPFCPEALAGSIFTLILNIGIPTICLVLGIVAESRQPNLATSLELMTEEYFLRGMGLEADLFKSILSVSTKKGVAAGGIKGIPDLVRGIFGSGQSGNLVPFLVGAADFIIQLLLALLPTLVAKQVFAGVAASTLIQALPGVGIAARILSGGALVAEVVQTVVEVLASPALFTNTLSLVMDTTVRIVHDPNDFRFPGRARHYEITLVYDEASKVAHKHSDAIEADRAAPIEWVFRGVPSGGKVTVDIVLTTEEGYIIGRSVDASGHEGPFGPIDNLPDPVVDPNMPPPTPKTIEVSIKEHLIPLTEGTRYLHDLELKVENGRRVWAEGAAPTATRAVLCLGQDDRLCTLGGITMNQRTGMAGYSFSAGGQGDRPYCGETSGGVMHLLQNLFLADDPESGLKVLPCGFRHPAGIVYERLAPADGRHFFFEPAADGQSYFLESVVLDTTSSFVLNNPLAWGRFTQALESVAVVSTGYVVGVSRLNHKMEILELPKAAVNRAEAPEAVPFAVLKAGEGTREGLLSAPVAVAVRDATILVLETGNARIQAFDVSANPVPVFHNGTSATVELEKAAELEYLDLAVEALGYMYVLSAANGGLVVDDYRLDVYTPQGNLLARTTGVAAARLAVDTFRNVYTLNFATLAGLARVEPSLSQWVPSTPNA